MGVMAAHIVSNPTFFQQLIQTNNKLHIPEIPRTKGQ